MKKKIYHRQTDSKQTHFLKLPLKLKYVQNLNIFLALYYFLYYVYSVKIDLSLFQDLVYPGDGNNWRSIVLSLLVIGMVIAGIVTAIYMLGYVDELLYWSGRRMKLQEYLQGTRVHKHSIVRQTKQKQIIQRQEEKVIKVAVVFCFVFYVVLLCLSYLAFNSPNTFRPSFKFCFLFFSNNK